MGRNKVDFQTYKRYDFKNKNEFVLDFVEIGETKVNNIEDVIHNRSRSATLKLLQKKYTLNVIDDSFASKANTMLNEDVEVTEYAPDVFAFLRQMDGYDNDNLRKSLAPDKNLNSVFKAGES